MRQTMVEEKKPSAKDGSTKKRWDNTRKKHHGYNSKPAVRPAKFTGGKEELGGNYFDCTGYGQSNRFVKTVQKIADHIGQEYRGGGVTRTEVMTQSHVTIPAPTRPTGTPKTTAGRTATMTPSDTLDISDYQSAKKIMDQKVVNQAENRQKVFS